MAGNRGSSRVLPPAATDTQGGAVGFPRLPGLAGEGAGAAPGMCDLLPAPDLAMFAALWRAYATQKELNATLKHYVRALERQIEQQDTRADLAEIETPAPNPRVLN